MFSLFSPAVSSPRLERLRNLSLFVDLTAAELRNVDDLLHEREYVAGEVIFDAGEEGQGLYIVVSGEVTICRQEQGNVKQVAQLGPGTFFGELALLDNLPRSAQARAATPCCLIVFFREDFLNLLHTQARIASKISRELASHLAARVREMALLVGAHQHL